MKQNKTTLLMAVVITLGAAGIGAYSYYTQTKHDQSSDSSLEAQSVDTNAQDQKASDRQAAEGRLVDDFPSDAIPLYPSGDVVESSQATNFMGKPEYNVHIKTSDAMQAAAERLETDYMNEGWDIKSYPTDKSFVSHSDAHIVTVSFAEDENGTSIRYYVSVK